MHPTSATLRWATPGLVITMLLCAGPAVFADSDSGPSVLFKTKCSSCHTFGKGERIGPDLKGATERYARPWLIAWIRSSEAMIRGGDLAANALFKKYRRQRMPDHELSDAQIGALLDYLAAEGPAADERQRIRFANTATVEEVAMGRKLFFGEARLASGGLACASCHALSTLGGFGGSLAADLSDIFTRYLDRALDRKLTQASSHTGGVAERESLALRAFLRSVGAAAKQGGSGGARGGHTPAQLGR